MSMNPLRNPADRRPARIRRALAAAGGVLALLVGCAGEAGPSLSAPDAYDQTKAGSITLIDIRTPPEWRQTGVAEGALRIDMRQPGGPQAFADAVLAQVGGDKAAPIALICRTGSRTAAMQQELQSRGFSHVYTVAEGMAGSAAGPGWLKRGLPVVLCPSC